MPHPTDGSIEALRDRSAAVAVLGLGYVGLPLARCLGRCFRVIGYDVDRQRIDRLGADPSELEGVGITLTADPAALTGARWFVVAVPTPVDDAKRPDFAPLLTACAVIARHLSPGSVVVFESTVYPGATEEVCVPELARLSGLSAGADFAYGYSPERINPGDREHTIERVVKVVSGGDAPTTDAIAQVYGAAIPAGVHRAPSVRVAEAAKVIENTQRDLNIALMNELALIFHRLDLDTAEVLATAGTKWNFLPFRPGLVGGHCIGVDPYYLTHKAQAVGYHPQVILAGRRINDGMGPFIAQECVRLIIAGGAAVKGCRVLVLGIAFKEDIADIRNSRVGDIIGELRRFGAVPVVVDPHADGDAVRKQHGVALIDLASARDCAAVIAAVAHAAFREQPLGAIAAACVPGAPFLDVKAVHDRAELARHGFTVWRL